MYLHLGKNAVILCKDIVGIFDTDSATVSKITRDYLSVSEKKGEVINVFSDLPNSFAVCAEKNKRENKVYISQISSATLAKRFEKF